MNIEDIKIPDPILNSKEEKRLKEIEEEYRKLVEPSFIGRGIQKAMDAIPQELKNIISEIGLKVSEQAIIKSIAEKSTDVFKYVMQNTSQFTISKSGILKEINKVSNVKIEDIEQSCLLRGYEIEKIVNKLNFRNVGYAAVGGAATGAGGIVVGLSCGIGINLFLCFRVVQEIAMFYGYNAKEDPSEMICAAEVFKNSLNPGVTKNEMANVISKVYTFNNTKALRNVTINMSWTKIAGKGKLPLAITKLRSLTNKSAEKALKKIGEKTGKEILEKSIFKDMLEEISKMLPKKSISKLGLGIGMFFGSVLDGWQMKQVAQLANLFYLKRFLLEKEYNITNLLDNHSD